MEKKIVCINQYPLNPRSKRLSYIEAFMLTGIKFEYWDTSRFFSMSGMALNSQEDVSYVKRYSTIGELKNALSECDCAHSLFFMGIPERLEDKNFYKLLSDYGCRIIKVDQCASTIRIPKSAKDIITFICSPNRLNNYFKRLSLKHFFKKNDIHYFDFFSSSVLSGRTRPINHPDFDDYKIAVKMKKESIIKGQYAVFYDSYFPLHPDFKYIHKLKIKVDYRHYLDSMNRFFTWIERKYDLNVIIAAHPSSNYSPDDFNGRKIIKWHTCELTINAQLVINQSSNSTSFALLANKPILFTTCDDIEKCPYLSKYIFTLSHLLGKEKINIDSMDYDKLDISPVNEMLRQKYIYTFLTDKTTENKTNDEIFTEYVKSHIG